MVVDLHLEATFQDIVEFLSFVCAELDRVILLIGVIARSYKKRLSDFVFEQRREVVVIEALTAYNR